MFLSRYTYRCTLSTEVSGHTQACFPRFDDACSAFFTWEISLYSTDWSSYCRTQRIQRKHLGNLDRLLNALLTFSRKRPTVNISCKKAIRAEEAKFPEKTIIVPASITLENEFTQAKELSTLTTSTRWQYTLGNLQLCYARAYLRWRDSWCFKQFFVHT